jgi:hypothetical protein
MKQITAMNLKNWAANGIRSQIALLEREIAALRDQLKHLVTGEPAKKRGRPAKVKPATKKKTAKAKKSGFGKSWTPERRKKHADTIAARKSLQVTTDSSIGEGSLDDLQGKVVNINQSAAKAPADATVQIKPTGVTQ